MRLPFRIGLILAVALGAVGISQAQESLTKRDGQGPVKVAVTLTAAPAIGAPIKARITLDTHSVGLDGIAFEQAVTLRAPDGSDVLPMAVEQVKGGGHHREAVVVFPPLAQVPVVRIVVKNVGGVAERSFLWELPLKP